MTVHSASAVSPAARGTTYSATRIGLETGRRRQRDGSSHRRPGPGAEAGADAPLELAGAVGWDVDVKVDVGAGESSSAGAREQPPRLTASPRSPATAADEPDERAAAAVVWPKRTRMRILRMHGTEVRATLLRHERGAKLTGSTADRTCGRPQGPAGSHAGPGGRVA